MIQTGNFWIHPCILNISATAISDNEEI